MNSQHIITVKMIAQENLPLLKHYHWVSIHIAHVDEFTQFYHLRLLPHHQPANVREEETA